MKLPFLSLKMMVKSGIEFIWKLTEPLQSCCCPVQKNLPSRAELAWQVSRYLWRGSVNFKINSRPLFAIIFKLKNVNFRTRDFSPLIEWVLVGVSWWKQPTLNYYYILFILINNLFSNLLSDIFALKWNFLPNNIT